MYECDLHAENLLEIDTVQYSYLLFVFQKAEHTADASRNLIGNRLQHMYQTRNYAH